MYLANIHPNGRPHYVIRETYAEGEHLLCRDLFDLGPHPDRYIRYPGGNAFYVNESVETTVRANGAQPAIHEIEDLLWEFVDPQVRHAVGYFRDRGRHRPLSKPEGDIPHPFDQRRMAYLRCGPTASGRIGRVPERLMRPLLGKSRDEREQLFLAMEKQLRAFELKRYVFQVFDLQKEICTFFGRSVPQWIDARRLDDQFEEALCRLHGDGDFWNGMATGENLNPYLIRYAIMFFDGDFGPPGILQDMLNQYIDQRRRFQWPESFKKVALQEAATLFDLAPETLKQCSRQDLIRHYRRAALRLHPDQGGDPARFVRLTEVYRTLLHRRHEDSP